jgi:mono/diheme cytochrome c family protein
MIDRVAFRNAAGLAAFTLALSSQAGAQTLSTDLGEFEYMNSCASCHGAEGAGNGPLADLLNTAPPDLTTLQAANGGVFPVSQAYAIIDGSADVGAHGSREMPAWGMRYMERAGESADMAPGAVDEYPRMRILALIEYLSTIQK